MIELADTSPDTNVRESEYLRLLGYPRDHQLNDRASALADVARRWYAQHGRPWVYARQVNQLSIENGSILTDGQSFTSGWLHRSLSDAQSQSAIVVAVSAGGGLEAEAQRAWKEEKPDEYFFLEVFGSAVVEHLITTIGARLCAWADGQGISVLPHYSPGYPQWDIAQQARLLELIRCTRNESLPGQVDVLESGMLNPKKSLLAIFGLAPQSEQSRRLSELVPCENCSFSPCQYRRAPYSRVPEYSKLMFSARRDVVGPLSRNAKYVVNTNALARWARERLTLLPRDDGGIDATFRYDGTTCANMGRSFVFLYHVTLGPRELGYPIREMLAGPAPGDEGHRFMCRYMNNAEHMSVAIEREKPLLGRRLDDVLTWKRSTIAPGCHCEPDSRKHKWGLALETIHYALSQREGNE